MFSTLSKTEIIIFVTFNLSSANAFNLVWSKIVSRGNGLYCLYRAIKLTIFISIVTRHAKLIYYHVNNRHGANSYRVDCRHTIISFRWDGLNATSNNYEQCSSQLTCQSSLLPDLITIIANVTCSTCFMSVNADFFSNLAIEIRQRTRCHT